MFQIFFIYLKYEQLFLSGLQFHRLPQTIVWMVFTRKMFPNGLGSRLGHFLNGNLNQH